MIDIVEKYLETSLDILGTEKKYFFANKYGPKKCPDDQQKRGDQKHLYSWSHFAPQQWFDYHRRSEAEIKSAKSG